MKWNGILSCLLLPLSQYLLAQPCQRDLRFDDTEYFREAELIVPRRAQFPESFSLKEYCPKPSVQLGYATGVSWATTYFAATILQAQRAGLREKDRISRNAFSPAFNYRASKSREDSLCREGITLPGSLKNLSQSGSPLYRNDWDPCARFSLPESPGQTPYFRPGGYARIFARGDSEKEKIEKVKAQLCQGRPVVIGMSAPTSFCGAREVWQPFDDDRVELEGKALCVVGYDDNAYGGGFEVVNSWGREWGKDGFTIIRYGHFSRFTRYAFLLYDEPRWSRGFEIAVHSQLSSGGEMQLSGIGNGKYEFDRAYPSGTRFNFSVTGNGEAHVYLLGKDANGSMSLLFPERSTKPFLSISTVPISLPGAGIFIELDSRKGRDELIFLVSMKELEMKRVMKVAGSPPPDKAVAWMEIPGFSLRGDMHDGLVVFSVFIDHI